MITWDGAQPTDVHRQRLSLARQRGREWHRRWQTVQPYILLAFVVVLWETASYQFWKAALR